MSADERDDPLLHELDSLKGLLEAGRSNPDDSVDGLQMSTGDGSDDDDDALPEEFLRGWDDEALDTDRRPQAGTSAEEEEFLPEAYLVEVEKTAPEAKPPAGDVTDAPTESSPPEATSEPETAEPPIPTLEDAVGSGSNPAAVQPDEAEVPVLDEAVTAEDMRQKAPDALGATSWEELEAIIDLLVERRLDSMREVLKKELLEELEHHTGLEPPA